MSARTKTRCEEYAEALGKTWDTRKCCWSCHEDEDEGYPICESEIGDVTYSICCAAANALDDERAVQP